MLSSLIYITHLFYRKQTFCRKNSINSLPPGIRSIYSILTQGVKLNPYRVDRQPLKGKERGPVQLVKNESPSCFYFALISLLYSGGSPDWASILARLSRLALGRGWRWCWWLLMVLMIADGADGASRLALGRGWRWWWWWRCWRRAWCGWHLGRLPQFERGRHLQVQIIIFFWQITIFWLANSGTKLDQMDSLSMSG